MAPVTANLGSVPEADARAIAACVAEIMGQPNRAPRPRRGGPRGDPADIEAPPGAGRRHRQRDRGRHLCRAPAKAASGRRPPPFGGLNLHLSTAVNGPNPQNIINVVLFGLPLPRRAERHDAGLSRRLNEDQLVALLEHMRERLRRPAWTDTRERVAATMRGGGSRSIAWTARPGPTGVQHEDDAMTVTLSVNGKTHRVEADPETPLLYVLRDDLQLNGAKYGCGIGQCGSCTVMVDGEAVLSCVTPLLLLEGRKVTTVEGLGTLENPGPMQRAFIEEQAAQCGYCIPGMMMRARRCCRRPAAGEAAVRAQLEPSCRCGAYAHRQGDARRRADAAELPSGGAT